MLRFQHASLVLVLVTLSACASAPRSGGRYQDGALANLDAAPQKLAPPDFGAGFSNTDPAYLKAQADYHFTLAETYGFRGQGARAAEEYKAVLVYDPKSVHVRLRLAAEYVHLGMMTEAIEQGEMAVELDPKNVEAHVLLGGVYAGLKLYAPARHQFQAILNLEPGHAEASLYLGALLAEEHKFDEAITYFTALAANPKFAETEKAYYYIGRVRADQGDQHYANAKRAFRKALELRPEYPEAALALASLDFAHHAEADAEKTLRGYQDKFGPNHEMSRMLGQFYLDHSKFDRALAALENVDAFERDNLNVKIQIALILVEEKRFDQAALRLEDILLLAPESEKVHYYLGAVYEEIHRTDGAIEHYAKVPPESTYYVEATIHRGHLEEANGHLDRALSALAESIERAPDQASLYAFYATLLDQRKDYALGVSVMTRAVARFPEDTQLRFFLGTMYDRSGNQKEAVVQMQQVINADHDNVAALNYLAFVYAEQSRDLDQAVDYAERAIKLAPTDGYILDTVGWVRFKRNEIAPAIQYLEAAVRAKPTEAIIHEHLGDAYLRNQMWLKARAVYQKAMSLELDQARHSGLRRKLEAVQTQAGRLPAGA